jgi:hypothetical protein
MTPARHSRLRPAPLDANGTAIPLFAPFLIDL